MSLTLSDEELQELTNGLTQPAAQLRELRRQGFFRACRPRGGRVMLPRAHYEAVVASREAAAESAQNDQPTAESVVVGLQAWASSRKGRDGQKAQGR